MRGVRLSANHCPRLGVSLLTALAIVFAGSLSAQSASTAAGLLPLEQAAADGIRKKVTQNWNLMPGLPGMKDVHVRIRIKLDRGGQILGKPEVTTSGGPEEAQTAVAASAVRAVVRAAPFENLPQTQFDNETGSAEVILNFAPGDMAL